MTLCQNLITITCRPGDEVLFGWRSFETYPLATRLVGAVPVQIPLDDGLAYDLPSMAQAITDRTRLIFVCNPNNPTGTVVSREHLVAFLRAVPRRRRRRARRGLLRVHAPRRLPGLRRPGTTARVQKPRHPANVLQGVRAGRPARRIRRRRPAVITALGKAHIPFSINSLAQRAAIACLDADDELLARTDAIVVERARVTAELRELGYRVPESQANFVWIALGDDAVPFAKAAVDAGVILRPSTATACASP